MGTAWHPLDGASACWPVRKQGEHHLAKESPNVITPPVDSAQDILELTVETNLLASDDANVNAYELRNALLLQRRLARVRYENGVTLPATAKKLRADTSRDVRHSRTLARNIKRATGDAKLPKPMRITSSLRPTSVRFARVGSCSGGASASTTRTTACICPRSGHPKFLASRTRPRTRSSTPRHTISPSRPGWP